MYLFLVRFHKRNKPDFWAPQQFDDILIVKNPRMNPSLIYNSIFVFPRSRCQSFTETFASLLLQFCYFNKGWSSMLWIFHIFMGWVRITKSMTLCEIGKHQPTRSKIVDVALEPFILSIIKLRDFKRTFYLPSCRFSIDGCDAISKWTSFLAWIKTS